MISLILYSQLENVVTIMTKQNKEQIYHNVALRERTYSLLLKRGIKGESFDQIVARLLKEKSVGLQKTKKELEL